MKLHIKHIVAIIALMILPVVAQAQSGSFTLLSGTATNGWITDGTNKLWVLNKVTSTNDFSGTFNTVTNLATYCRAKSFIVPSQTFGMAAAAAHSGSQTGAQIYVLQKSMNGVYWETLTNVSFQLTNTTPQFGNFSITTLGDYQYVRLYNISNTIPAPASAASVSNYVAFFWKH